MTTFIRCQFNNDLCCEPQLPETHHREGWEILGRFTVTREARPVIMADTTNRHRRDGVIADEWGYDLRAWSGSCGSKGSIVHRSDIRIVPGSDELHGIFDTEDVSNPPEVGDPPIRQYPGPNGEPPHWNAHRAIIAPWAGTIWDCCTQFFSFSAPKRRTF